MPGAAWVGLQSLCFPSCEQDESSVLLGFSHWCWRTWNYFLVLLSVRIWFGCADNWKAEGFFPSLGSWLVADKLLCGFFLGARWLSFQADVISCYLSVVQPASPKLFLVLPNMPLFGIFYFFFLWVWGKQDAENKVVSCWAWRTPGGAQHVDLRFLVKLRKIIRSLWEDLLSATYF